MRRRIRKTLTLLALIVMVALIAGYGFVTNSDRVRRFAEKQLSLELGAAVSIGNAKLSIFEGLRLDDIRVVPTAGGQPIFQAKRVHVSYNPRSLFRGDVAAERVVAVEPRVRLVEDLDSKRWNFQLLDRNSQGGAAMRSSGTRGVSICRKSSCAAPASITPTSRTAARATSAPCSSKANSRPTPAACTASACKAAAGRNGPFPSPKAGSKSDGSAMGLVVSDVEFVDEIKSILPADVRRFWEAHRLSGRLDDLQLDLYRKPNGRAGYKVQTDLSGVSLVIPPVTWMGPNDRQQVQRWEQSYTALASPTLGGSLVASKIIDAMSPEPLKLDDVDARFTFTDERIGIDRLVAHVDNNALLFTGHIDGYNADAAVDLNVQTPPAAA